jgi:acetyltransferase-like isoleucine patch superfamily enzyme
VVFSNGVEACAHVIARQDGGEQLLVKRIHIGDRAVLGQGVRLAAGSRVPKGASAASGVQVRVNETLGVDVRHATPEEAAIADHGQRV